MWGKPHPSLSSVQLSAQHVQTTKSNLTSRRHLLVSSLRYSHSSLIDYRATQVRMDQLAAQISAAVKCALDPSPCTPAETRSQAYTFLQQVRDASLETWQPCLNFFLDTSWSKEERMFGVQVVGDRSVACFQCSPFPASLFSWGYRACCSSGRVIRGSSTATDYICPAFEQGQ